MRRTSGAVSTKALFEIVLTFLKYFCLSARAAIYHFNHGLNSCLRKVIWHKCFLSIAKKVTSVLFVNLTSPSLFWRCFYFTPRHRSENRTITACKRALINKRSYDVSTYACGILLSGNWFLNNLNFRNIIAYGSLVLRILVPMKY